MTLPSFPACVTPRCCRGPERVDVQVAMQHGSAVLRPAGIVRSRAVAVRFTSDSAHTIGWCVDHRCQERAAFTPRCTTPFAASIVFRSKLQDLLVHNHVQLLPAPASDSGQGLRRFGPPTITMSQDANGSAQSTLQAASAFVSEKAGQAQAAVTNAAKNVKAAVRFLNHTGAQCRVSLYLPVVCGVKMHCWRSLSS